MGKGIGICMSIGKGFCIHRCMYVYCIDIHTYVYAIYCCLSLSIYIYIGIGNRYWYMYGNWYFISIGKGFCMSIVICMGRWYVYGNWYLYY